MGPKLRIVEFWRWEEHRVNFFLKVSAHSYQKIGFSECSFSFQKDFTFFKILVIV